MKLSKKEILVRFSISQIVAILFVTIVVQLNYVSERSVVVGVLVVPSLIAAIWVVEKFSEKFRR
jgi:uncharacterized membrane protein YkvI